MLYSSIFIVSLLLLATINQSVALQCYKCGCFVIPGETTCLAESELNCVIQYMEDTHCYISRSPGDIEFGHNSNSVLAFMESLHYIRATELISYSESTSSWEAPTVTTVFYGCDWNLCNTPRILSLLPSGLTYAVDTTLLTDTLIADSSEPLTSCLECPTTCINSTEETNCSTPACIGTCFIDDHFDDPGFNTEACLFAFESFCINVTLNTSVEILGTYYIDDRLFEITEIDIYCQKTNCNHPASVQLIQKNTTFSTQINDQLYFRPTTVSTTPSPNNGQFACYKCDCQQEVGSSDCTILECTIEYQNASYCEIVRDFKDVAGYERITLGHVQRSAVPYKHFIIAEEELILYKNLTWNLPSINIITYVCDWELCNDGRIVDRLTTSFQFDARPSDIAEYLHSSDPLETCLGCSLCTNSTLDIDDECEKVNCSSTGQCFIDQHVDDPQYDNCEYAFEAMCVPDVSESSIIITATYSIDDDKLEFDEVDVYCSANNCNNVSTVYALIDLLSEDIKLDSLFFIRPSENTTVPLNITEPTPSSTSTISSVTTTFQTTTTTGSPLTPTTTTTTTTTSSTTTTTTVSTSTTTTTTTTSSSSSAISSTTTRSSTSSTTLSPNSATILNYSSSYVFFIVFSLFIIIN